MDNEKKIKFEKLDGVKPYKIVNTINIIQKTFK